MTNFPSFSSVKISAMTLTHSASGIIRSYSPAISKSYRLQKRNQTFLANDDLHINHRIARKFGGELNLAVWRSGGLYYNRRIKIRQNFLLAYIRMAIPYQTTKFKSVNILAIAILDSTAKFNACQYFQLYSISLLL